MVELIKGSIKFVKAALIIVTGIFFLDIIGVVNYINRKTGTKTQLSKLLIDEKTYSYYGCFYLISIGTIILLSAWLECEKRKESNYKVEQAKNFSSGNEKIIKIKYLNNTCKIMNNENNQTVIVISKNKVFPSPRKSRKTIYQKRRK